MNKIIYLNGNKLEIDLSKCSNLSDLIDKFYLKFKNKNIAVAVNMKIVTKSEWNTYRLEKNDKIEIVVPFPGG